jgi:hypothetical protein
MGESNEAVECKASSSRTEHILIDYENVQPSDLALVESGPFRVKIFIGPKQAAIPKDVVLTMQKFGGDFIDVSTVGNNAADFHIAYYLGRIATTEPEACLHVISKDTGFDPLIQHLRKHGWYARRSECIGEIPSVKAAEKQKRKKLVSDAVEFLGRTEVENRPGTLEALRKALAAHFKQLNAESVEELIQVLKSRQFFMESAGKIEYLKPTSET